MSATAHEVPEDRYGDSRRGDPNPIRRDARDERRLRVAAVVFVVFLLGLVVWLGGSYVMQASKMYGSVPTYQVTSDSTVQAHLSVTKSDGMSGTCTLRSQKADKEVVGQVDVPVPAAGKTFETTVTIRTTSRGATAELLGCTPDD
jgi:hypothetical protein